MARASGRNATIYIDVSSAGNASASPVSYVNQWQLDQSIDTPEVTSFGDSNKVYVPGLADTKGSLSGFLNLGTATFQNLTTAVSGGRKMYLYPDAQNNSGVYWFGTAHLSGSYSGSTSDAIKVSLSLVAGSSWSIVGSL